MLTYSLLNFHYLALSNVMYHISRLYRALKLWARLLEIAKKD